jgi:hypothetical protein
MGVDKLPWQPLEMRDVWLSLVTTQECPKWSFGLSSLYTTLGELDTVISHGIGPIYTSRPFHSLASTGTLVLVSFFLCQDMSTEPFRRTEEIVVLSAKNVRTFVRQCICQTCQQNKCSTYLKITGHVLFLIFTNKNLQYFHMLFTQCQYTIHINHDEKPPQQPSHLDQCATQQLPCKVRQIHWNKRSLSIQP